MLLNERLTTFIDNNNLMSQNHAGFRKGYSTIDHIFLFKQIIELFRFKKTKLFCAFIDYQKAFDTVWREGLRYKMEKLYNIKGKILTVIKNLYSNIKSCVFVGGERSDFLRALQELDKGKIYHHCCFHCLLMI